MDNLLLSFPKDVAYLISNYLTPQDISNMYKAGGYLKLFVSKYFLKDGCLTKLVINGHDKIRDFINLFGKMYESRNRSLEVRLEFGIYNVSFTCNNEHNLCYIDFKRSFFDEYWCSMPISDIQTDAYYIHKLCVSDVDILELLIFIDNKSVIVCNSKMSKYDLTYTQYISDKMIVYKRYPNVRYSSDVLNRPWDVDFDFISKLFNFCRKNIFAVGDVKLINNNDGLIIQQGTEIYANPYVNGFMTTSDDKKLIIGNPSPHGSSIVLHVANDALWCIPYNLHHYGHTTNLKYNKSNIIVTNKNDDIGFSFVFIKQCK